MYLDLPRDYIRQLRLEATDMEVFLWWNEKKNGDVLGNMGLSGNEGFQNRFMCYGNIPINHLSHWGTQYFETDPYRKGEKSIL